MKEVLINGYQRLSAGAAFVGLAVACMIVGYFNPTTTGIFPACPTLALTGFACPGCGLTRGFHALFNGEILTALSFNALIPIYFIFLLYIVGMLLSISLRGKSLQYKFFAPALFMGYMGIALVFGVLRNIPVHPFTVLYP